VCYTVWDGIPKADGHTDTDSRAGDVEQKLDDEQMKQDLDSLGIGEDINTNIATEQV
jgi:hypothetical protein